MERMTRSSRSADGFSLLTPKNTIAYCAVHGWRKRWRSTKVSAAAEAKATQNNWYVAISIMDSGGNPVMLHRLDGTQLASIRIAEGKALTTVEFRRPTKAMEDVIARGGAGLRYFTVPNVNFMEGGMARLLAALACPAWTRRTMLK
jgi:uncharacterized protein GlcG (DUF336 family)